MKIPNSSAKERLDFFRELYDGAKVAYSDQLAEFERHMNQYRGSDELDGTAVRATTVRNITYEMIETQVSSDIPSPKVNPACYSERKDRCAKSIERLLYSVRERLPFETMNDIDERYTYVFGGSVWYAEWDNTARVGKEIGGVRVYCLPPRDFIPQPSISELADMQYCFLRFTTTKSEIARKYGVKNEDLYELECVESHENTNDETECVPLIIAFYKDGDGDVGRFTFSGNLTLQDLPKMYRRKRKLCKQCRMIPDLCECKKKEWISEDVTAELIDGGILTSDGYVKDTFTTEPYEIRSPYPDMGVGRVKVPYYTPDSFPIVIRKNTSGDGRLFGQSDCEYIRPEQQAINKIESRILQKLLRAGITPIVPEDATITLNNSVFGQVIKIRPGESASQYGKVDTTPDISQDIAEAERLYEHSKRILGISDALMGVDTARFESGYAKQLRINQASGRLESKRKMKYTAYAALDKKIFELYLAFADEARALIYKDAYGRIHDIGFNRYDFLEYDSERGTFYFDDAYLFSVDLNGGAEYQREELWQRNLENLKAGTLGAPDSPVTLLRYWQCQERAHYPHARENVEYFTMAVEDEKRRLEYVEEHA